MGRSQAEAASSPAGYDEGKATVKRIVIHNATLSVGVDSRDSANARLSRIAAGAGGYAVTLGNDMSVIRVKTELLASTIVEISTLGKVTDKSISGNDVTDEYSDYQLRLESATKARTRYLELLAKAENVEATLKVEKELERLSIEIEQLEGKIKKIDHLAAYSTISVHYHDLMKPGLLGYVAVGLYKSVKWLFVRG
jgi:Domain of unknown function (DUF4349)